MRSGGSNELAWTSTIDPGVARLAKFSRLKSLTEHVMFFQLNALINEFQ